MLTPSFLDKKILEAHWPVSLLIPMLTHVKELIAETIAVKLCVEVSCYLKATRIAVQKTCPSSPESSDYLKQIEQVVTAKVWEQLRCETIKPVTEYSRKYYRLWTVSMQSYTIKDWRLKRNYTTGKVYHAYTFWPECKSVLKASSMMQRRGEEEG